MSLVLKLTKGKRSIDLTSGRYRPSEAFVPPVSSISTLIASSTSANRYNAGEKIGDRLSPHGYGLSLQLRGNTSADISDASRALARFLAMAGDPAEPLYLEHRAEAPTQAEPFWGQFGSNMRYEIIGANVPNPAPLYSEGDMRTKHVPITVSLTIKPTAIGKKQRMASATGGVLEDTIGSVDGRSQGLSIPEATTNKFTNPIFGHGTWDNGWTTSDISSSEEKDRSLVLFGSSSAFLERKSLAAANPTFTQSINVGNTNQHTISCYARKADGSSIDSTSLSLRYAGVSLTTTFELVGDGWHRLSASFTGIASAQTCGILLSPTTSIFVDGFQVEEKAYYTNLAFGDMLGCSWSGTAHASTSSRTAGRVRIAGDDGIYANSGTLRVVWQADANSADLTADIYLAHSTQSDAALYYDQSAGAWTWEDFLSTLQSVTAFSKGDKISFHITWEKGASNFYIDGALVDSIANFTTDLIGDYLYIGTSNAVANHANGRFLDFSTYDTPMTATQVSEDFALLDGVLESGYRPGAIPWLWTKDGDDIIDNCDDATRDNFMVCGGVPGNVEAKTTIEFTPSADENYYWIGNKTIGYDRFIYPTPSQWFLDYQGTVDASYCGGEYQWYIPVSAWEQVMSVTEPDLVSGKTHLFLRVASSSGTASIVLTPFYRYGASGTDIEGKQVTHSVPATADMYYLGDLYIDFHQGINVAEYALEIGYKSPNAASIFLDYLLVVNGDLLRIATGGATVNSIFLDGDFAQDISATGLGSIYPAAGDTLNLKPRALNNVWFMSSGGNLVASTYTIDRLEITPRYTTI